MVGGGAGRPGHWSGTGYYSGRGSAALFFRVLLSEGAEVWDRRFTGRVCAGAKSYPHARWLGHTLTPTTGSWRQPRTLRVSASESKEFSPPGPRRGGIGNGCIGSTTVTFAGCRPSTAIATRSECLLRRLWKDCRGCVFHDDRPIRFVFLYD